MPNPTATGAPEAARALNNLGVLLWGRGELRRSQELIDEAVRLAEQFGHVSVLRHARSQQICQLLDRGDWETGLREADAFIAADERSAVEDAILRRRARIRLGRGDVVGALDDVRRALESARAMKDPQTVIPTLGSAIRLYVEAGVATEARPLAEEFVHGFPAGGNDWMLIDFAWAAASIDYGGELRQLLDDLPFVSTYGEVEGALLDLDYERAANLFHEIGEAENEAAARLRAAAQLIGDGRLSDAAGFVEDALAFYRSVDATRYINEGEALLAARASAS